MTYYAQTMPGVEEIAWLEIRRRLKDAHFQRYLFAKEQNGIVVFDYPGPAAELLRLRTTEDVFMQIAYHNDLTRLRRDLKGIHELIASSEGSAAPSMTICGCAVSALHPPIASSAANMASSSIRASI